jgi:hypothetical protein
MTDYNSKAHLELIDKQAKLLEAMMQPTMFITQETLRDKFAMFALTGIIFTHTTLSEDGAVEMAIRYADAMMEKRK